MKVRRGQRHVAQAGHLEDVPVRRILGHVVAPQVGARGVAALGEVVAHHAEGLEHVAADVDPLVTGHAAVRLEQLVSLQLIHRDGVLVTAQVFVETRVGRDQRALEGRQCIGDGARLQAVRVAFLELGDQRGILAQLAHHLGPAAAHLQRVVHGASDLLLQRVGATVPELPEVEAGIEDGGRVRRPASSRSDGRLTRC